MIEIRYIVPLQKPLKTLSNSGSSMVELLTHNHENLESQLWQALVVSMSSVH